MLTGEKPKMMTVTARQINEAANSIKVGYSALSKDWAKQSIDAAVNHRGKVEIEYSSLLAGIIRSLR